MEHPTSPLVAVATGVIGAAWASGSIASLSLMGCPAALAVPTSSAKIWSVLFNRGIAIMPKVAGGVALSYLYAAYDTRKRRSPTWAGYVGAAVLSVAIVPYTLLFMSKTNAALHAAVSQQPSAGDVSGLIGDWQALNLGRSLFPFASAVAGVVTVFKSTL